MVGDELNDDHDHEVEEEVAEGQVGTVAEDSLGLVHDNHSNDSLEHAHSDHSVARHSQPAPVAHQMLCRTHLEQQLALDDLQEVACPIRIHSIWETVLAQVGALQNRFSEFFIAMGYIKSLNFYA